MTLRVEQKRKTKEKILTTARHIFEKKGFLNTATAYIAKECGIAHGTLFSHFANKELLIVEIIDIEMAALGSALNEIYQNSNGLSDLFDYYLDFLASKEKFFSFLYKEFPFYEDSLKRKIIFRESVIRNYFFEASQDYLGETENTDTITMACSTLFAILQYYIMNKDIYNADGSVVNQFRTYFKTTFFTLLGGNKNETDM